MSRIENTYEDYKRYRIQSIGNGKYKIIFANGGPTIVVDEGIMADLYKAKFYDKEHPMEGPLTGDKYKDKPWTANYLGNGPKSDFDITLPFYQNFYSACLNEPTGPIMYFSDGKTITSRELRELSLNLAAYLQQVTKKPKIAMFVNNTMEEPVSFLATSLCGGIIHPVDITKTPGDMKKSVDNFNPDIIIMDERITPLLPLLNDKKVPVVVANTKNEYGTKEMVSFNEAIEDGRKREFKPEDNFDPEAPFLVITSSGTTGAPKPIVLSHQAVNLAVLKVLFTDYPLNRDNIMMKVIPAHIGLGIITTLSTCLISGTKLAFIEGNGPEDSVRVALDFIRNFSKFREDNKLSNDQNLLMFAAPMFYREMLNEIDSFDDLSYMVCMLAAGSKMSEEELIDMQAKFGEKGCRVGVGNGYGSNENAGAVTLNTISNNTYGSGGFPVIGTDVLIVGNDNKPLEEGEGRIVVRAGSQFLYYLGMPETTENARVSLQGDTWNEMKDIGSMDSTGATFITGRTTRVITKHDCKVSIDFVESKLRQHPGINDCAIIAIQNNSTDIVYAFVTLNDGYEYTNVVADMQNHPDWLSPEEMPDYIISIGTFPALSSGKIDYQALTAIAREDLMQTNAQHQDDKKGIKSLALRRNPLKETQKKED